MVVVIVVVVVVGVVVVTVCKGRERRVSWMLCSHLRQHNDPQPITPTACMNICSYPFLAVTFGGRSRGRGLRSGGDCVEMDKVEVVICGAGSDLCWDHRSHHNDDHSRSPNHPNQIYTDSGRRDTCKDTDTRTDMCTDTQIPAPTHACTDTNTDIDQH